MVWQSCNHRFYYHFLPPPPPPRWKTWKSIHLLYCSSDLKQNQKHVFLILLYSQKFSNKIPHPLYSDSLKYPVVFVRWVLQFCDQIESKIFQNLYANPLPLRNTWQSWELFDIPLFVLCRRKDYLLQRGDEKLGDQALQPLCPSVVSLSPSF